MVGAERIETPHLAEAMQYRPREQLCHTPPLGLCPLAEDCWHRQHPLPLHRGVSAQRGAIGECRNGDRLWYNLEAADILDGHGWRSSTDESSMVKRFHVLAVEGVAAGDAVAQERKPT